MPYFSVVIPAFNSEKFLVAALDSVRHQDFSDFEIIIVNDGSTDSTGELAELWRKKYSQLNLKVKHQSNKKLGAARNAGIELSLGRYIAFLDSDDQWASNKLQAIGSLLTSHPDIDVVCHDEWIISTRKKAEIRHHGPSTTYEELLFKGNCLSPSATIVRSSCIRMAGGFSEAPGFHGAEDYDLWLRLASNGCKFEYLNEPLGYYRIHDGMMSANIPEHSRHALNLLEHHFSKWEPKNTYYYRLMRKRKSITFRGCGHQLMRQRKMVEASRFLRTALRHNPLDWKTVALLLAIFFESITDKIR